MMGKKNHQIHIFLDKDLREVLEREATEKNISLSELCRQKLKENSQLTRIEIAIEKLSKRGADFGKRSSKIRDF
jgi:hypothetical protein